MLTIDVPPISNLLGFLALACYVITLLPTILRVVFPRLKKTGIPKRLLLQRRLIGILAFVFTVGHGWLLIEKRNFDFFDLKTSWIYFQGLATFTIFAILTATSNDWSVKKLRKNWKQLHKLTYLAMFLLTWHVWDKMSGHWTYVTPISIVAITVTALLFLSRLWIERQNRLKQSATKAS
ncbi:MAG: iron reductase [Cyanothece sp. SIO1E1]|nr:iron reductase [Cyanothece sp. SIO1E1]